MVTAIYQRREKFGNEILGKLQTVDAINHRRVEPLWPGVKSIADLNHSVNNHVI